MPSTVISSVLSYNEYFNLGVDYADVFKEDVLKGIPEYLLSKKYKRAELDGMWDSRLTEEEQMTNTWMVKSSLIISQSKVVYYLQNLDHMRLEHFNLPLSS